MANFDPFWGAACSSMHCAAREWMESEEVSKIDKALEESKKIQSSLESSIYQVEKLKSKYETASNNYFYNFSPSNRHSHRCSKAEYLIFSIYDVHLSKLCQKLDLYSPQRQKQQNFQSPQNRQHSRVQKINYTPSSCSSSPSTSSTELINQLELEEASFDAKFIGNGEKSFTYSNSYEPKSGLRTHKQLIRSYNRAKTERIKCKREIEAALTSLDKAIRLSTTRAVEAKNYGWIRTRMRTPIKNFSARRSISSSMCRVKPLTPVQVKRPLSTSVIF
ncbi:uncharacterized protein [Chironomus tepperi]|uniref:uncharacterized protein n=1 Tax=Chironomus tepperi TaxID=113505 RepID=UPI00391F3E2E